MSKSKKKTKILEKIKTPIINTSVTPSIFDEDTQIIDPKVLSALIRKTTIPCPAPKDIDSDYEEDDTVSSIEEYIEKITQEENEC
ncbi:MAG: hypothetical protein AABY22_36565 [Nanoarchaeota archaeon]